MPTPFDLMSEKLDEPDPDDQLRLQLGQDQGANLAGGPQQGADGQPQLPPSAQPMAPSPNVPGPLAALAPKPGKPKIKLKSKPTAPPPRMLKRKKPHIKLKSNPTSALQGFLNTIGN